MQFDIDKHTIYLTVHGSRAYGTFTPTSDYDYKGVAIPPKEYFLGYAFRFEQFEQKPKKSEETEDEAAGSDDQDEVEDKVVFDIRKFINLAADCNPNIIEVLHTDPSSHIVVTKIGERLLEARDLFLSKKAKHTFSGYAHAQLKRIKTHRSWLLNPPKGKPMRSDFGLPEEGNKVVSGSIMGAFDELNASGYSFGGEVMTAIQKEKQYATALQHWKQYKSWEANRNKDRAALEAKYGYDTKHGMHLVRLMRMCVEILEGKGVLVLRPDAEELREVRHGAWSYDQLMEEAERLEKRAEELYATSTLRHKPPVHELDKLCVSLVEEYLKGV
jgi:predicted nucleotidyltransferase